MLDMTEPVQPAHTERLGQARHCPQRLRRVSQPPRITREHVSRRGEIRRLEGKPGTPDHPLVMGGAYDVGTTAPPPPFGVAETEEYPRVVETGVTWPRQVTGDLRVGCVSFEDGASVGGHRSTKHEALRHELLGRHRAPHRPIGTRESLHLATRLRFLSGTEFDGDRLWNQALLPRFIHQPLDRRAATVAVLQGQVVDVHADETIGLRAFEPTAI